MFSDKEEPEKPSEEKMKIGEFLSKKGEIFTDDISENDISDTASGVTENTNKIKPVEKKISRPTVIQNDEETELKETFAVGAYGDVDLHNEDLEKVLARVRAMLKKADDPDLTDVSTSPEIKKRQKEKFPAVVQRAVTSLGLTVSREAMPGLAQMMFDVVLGFGPLEPLIAMPGVTDIECNSYDDLWIDSDLGRKRVKDIPGFENVRFRDKDHMFRIMQRIAQSANREINYSSPICDARLRDGSRVVMTLEPPAFGSHCITIRKFRRERYSFDDLVDNGTMSLSMSLLMRASVKARCNLLVVGPMSSGKTTFMGTILNEIEENDRCVVIEDTAELTLREDRNFLRKEQRKATIEGSESSEINMRDLVKASMRENAKRLVIGEVRGEEAIELLTAMSAGSYGSMATIHGNDPASGLRRLELFAQMAGQEVEPKYIRQMISEAVDLIICMQERNEIVVENGEEKEIKRRIMTHISEPIGVDPETDEIVISDIFRYQWGSEGEEFKQVGTISDWLKKTKFDYWNVPVRGLSGYERETEDDT